MQNHSIINDKLLGYFYFISGIFSLMDIEDLLIDGSVVEVLLFLESENPAAILFTAPWIFKKELMSFFPKKECCFVAFTVKVLQMKKLCISLPY